MANDTFTRFRWDLPSVDVPDWELVRQLVDTIRPYVRGGDNPDSWAIEATDGRGTSSETEIDALKAAVEGRGEAPHIDRDQGQRIREGDRHAASA